MTKQNLKTYKMLSQDQINVLVEQAQAGDQNAFGFLYDEFVNQIYRYVYFKTPSLEIAEDLTEDIFFKVWQNIKKYKRKKVPFSAWIFRIAHNEVVDFYRKNKETIELSEILTDEKRENKPEIIVERALLEKEIQKALKALPENQSQAIVLKYINDLSNKEIANTMNKSETAIRILLSRALAKLKKILANKGMEKLI